MCCPKLLREFMYYSSSLYFVCTKNETHIFSVNPFFFLMCVNFVLIN